MINEYTAVVIYMNNRMYSMHFYGVSELLMTVKLYLNPESKI